MQRPRDMYLSVSQRRYRETDSQASRTLRTSSNASRLCNIPSLVYYRADTCWTLSLPFSIHDIPAHSCAHVVHRVYTLRVSRRCHMAPLLVNLSPKLSATRTCLRKIQSTADLCMRETTRVQVLMRGRIVD